MVGHCFLPFVSPLASVIFPQLFPLGQGPCFGVQCCQDHPSCQLCLLSARVSSWLVTGLGALQDSCLSLCPCCCGCCCHCHSCALGQVPLFCGQQVVSKEHKQSPGQGLSPTVVRSDPYFWAMDCGCAQLKVQAFCLCLACEGHREHLFSTTPALASGMFPLNQVLGAADLLFFLLFG